MTRAVTQFEVVDVQFADMNSDNALDRCDKIVLKQLPMQRKQPISCQEMNSATAKGYCDHVRRMKLVDMFHEKFEVTFDCRQGMTKEEIHEHCNSPQMSDFWEGMARPSGKKGMTLWDRSETGDGSSDDIKRCSTFVAWTQNVAGHFDFLACRASQKETFLNDSFLQKKSDLTDTHKKSIQDKVRDDLRSDVWGRKFWFTKMWYWSSSWDAFDKIHDIDSQSESKAQQQADQHAIKTIAPIKQKQKDIAHEDHLAGFILHRAMVTGKLAIDDGKPDHFRLTVA